MTNRPSLKLQVLRFLLSAFYQPMVWVALALHGALLLIPISEPSKAELDDSLQAPEKPIQTVTLADLLALPPSASSPLESPVDTVISPPPGNRSAQLSPPLLQDAVPPPDTISTASPEPTGNATLTPEPAPALRPSSDPDILTGDQPISQSEGNANTAQTFVDQLAVTTGLPTNLPSPEVFSDASLYFDLLETPPTLNSEILKAVWIDGRTPEQIYLSVLNSQLQNSSFQTIQKNNYGGGSVYEVTQGETTWYLNLVPTANGNGTIIVVWKQDPSRLPTV
ncbi:MAG: hypothetical protein ACHWZW_17945 [Spirulina sp.]